MMCTVTLAKAKSALNRFLAECPVTLDDCDREVITHTSFDDGKWNIPCDRNCEFHQRYTNVMQCTMQAQNIDDPALFIVERKTPIFKMICDLDFEGTPESIDALQRSDAVRKGVQCIQALVADNFANDHGPLHVVVCVASGLLHKSNGKIKLGVHLIWPHLFLDRAASLVLRGMIIFRLHEKGHFQGFHLDTVVDKVVLEGSGLRMVGSYKLDRKCKDWQQCAHCKERGFSTHHFTDNRIYMPTYVVDSQGNDAPHVMEHFAADPFAMVQTLSIRTDLRHPPTRNNSIASPQLLAWYQTLTAENKRQRDAERTATKAKMARCSSFMPDFEALDRISEQDKELEAAMKATMPMITYEELLTKYKASEDHSAVCHDGSIKSAMQSFLAANFWEPYGQSAKVTRVSHNSESNSWTVGTDCKFCLNVHREHGSNNVYYVFTQRGVYQKCHNVKWDSHDQHERKESGKKCSEYKSPPIWMGLELMKMLNLDNGKPLIQITGKKRPLPHTCFEEAPQQGPNKQSSRNVVEEYVAPLTDDEIAGLFN